MVNSYGIMKRSQYLQIYIKLLFQPSHLCTSQKTQVNALSAILSMHISENTSECFINYLIYARLTKRIGKSKVPLPLPMPHIFPHSTMKGPLPFRLSSFIFQVLVKILQPMTQQDPNSWGSTLNELQKVKLSLFFINLPRRTASNSSSFNQ